jgi:hypothetical protein
MHKTFGEQLIDSSLVGTISNPKLRLWADRLTEHGEVQVLTASGGVYTMHLGDKGEFNNSMLLLIDREGQQHSIFWEQVEGINTHRGYKES